MKQPMVIGCPIKVRIKGMDAAFAYIWLGRLSQVQ